MANLSDRVSGDPHRTASNPNLLINGGFDIWQRGTGYSGGGYTADRWNIDNQFFIQSALVPDESAPWSGNIITDGIIEPNVYTSVELSNPAEGPAPFTNKKNYTLSFWAYRQNTDPFRIQLSYVDTVSEVTNQVMILDTVTQPVAGLTWEYLTLTFNIGANVPVPTNLSLQIQITAINDVNVGEINVNLALAKLEVGTKATPFTRAGNTLEGELAMCQRYYQHHFMGVGKFIGGGTDASCYGVFLVTMRVAPSITLIGSALPSVDEIGVGSVNIDSIASYSSTPYSGNVALNLSVAGTVDAICAITPLDSVFNINAEL